MLGSYARRVGSFAVLAVLVVLFIVCCIGFFEADDDSLASDLVICRAVNLIGMAASTILFFTMVLEGDLDEAMSRFSILVLMEFVLHISGYLTSLFTGNADYNTFYHFLLDLTYITITLMCFTFWCFVKTVIPDQTQFVKVLNRTSYLLLIVGIVMVVVNGVTGVFYDTEDAQYALTDLYVVSFALPFAILLISLAGIIKFISNRRMMLGLSVVVLFLIAGALVDSLADEDYGLLSVMVLLALFLLYGNFYVGRSNDLTMKDAELVQQRATILVSQIQPHFLYNALTSIMNIKGNPVETRDAISDFGKFMRGNLDTLTQKSAIPITKEMDHVETYILLEQLRLGQRLNYAFDIKCRNFLVPGLTVQVAVQECIEHGLSAADSSCTINVSTDETDDAYLIRIDDYGNSYTLECSPEPEEGMSPIDNVRLRLRDMVRGGLEIQSSPGAGTHITITIPKVKKKA